jgi:hypothetical protein
MPTTSKVADAALSVRNALSFSAIVRDMRTCGYGQRARAAARALSGCSASPMGSDNRALVAETHGRS